MRTMFLKCCQAIERIDFSKAVGVQAHERITNVPLGPFEELLTEVIIQWGVGDNVSTCQCFCM